MKELSEERRGARPISTIAAPSALARATAATPSAALLPSSSSVAC
jgi:hypothetical protein